MATTRITTKDLEAVCQRINRMTLGHEAEPEDVHTHPVDGTYYMSGAYGGYALYRVSVTDQGTGATDVLNRGHQSKREMYDLMQAFIRGMETRANA